MSHYDAAIFTARRLEMCEIVEMTLFYFLDRPQVHLALSGLPFMVSNLVNSLVFCLGFLYCVVSELYRKYLWEWVLNEYTFFKAVNVGLLLGCVVVCN